jgi:predicted amidohydrolase
MDIWKIILRARAIENNVDVIGCSLGSTYKNHPPYSWVGNSIVVDYEGRIVAQSPVGPSTQILVAPINVGSLREFRGKTSMLSLSHLRTELYKDVYERSVFPPSCGAEVKEVTQNSLREAIASVKEKLI